MLNDTIISGLINLFALFSTRNGGDTHHCQQLIDSYLSGHFGIRNKEPYIDLYDSFYATYEDESIDKEAVVKSITGSIKNVIEASELKLLQLRLMEFCKTTGGRFDPEDALFKTMARDFSVDDDTYHDFVNFVERKASSRVKLQTFDGYAGSICTLWLAEDRKLVFAYDGDDEVLINDVPVMHGLFQVWQPSCVLKNNKGASLYYSTVKHPYEAESPTQPLELCARDVVYRFPDGVIGIHDLNFTVHGGEMVALMGGSGSGKSTLFSLLNGNAHPAQGAITLNGHDITETAVKELVGFVPQDDLLIEELTVYQNLYYTARLCLDGLSEKEIDARVMNVLRDLGLDKHKDLKVGNPLNKTISGGQRKRLNIALELIREPAVLMLDEPTSGLSSADAEQVISLLKEQSYKGNLVIVCLHQPSSDVYKQFDRLWLLDKGGYFVYDGNPVEAITYFKKVANYVDPDTSACVTCGNVNPEVVLNIIDEKALDNVGNRSKERKTSPQEWASMFAATRTAMPAPRVTDTPPASLKRPNFFKQLLIQLQRNVAAKATNKQYLLLTLLTAPLLALVCAWLSRYAPDTGYTVMGNRNFVSFLFMAVIVVTFLGMIGSAEELIHDRILCKREKLLNLSFCSYISSKVVLLAIVSLVQSALFVIVSQCVLGFHDLFLQWWAILFVTAFVAALTGLLLSQCFDNIVTIYITIPLLLVPQILLCGLVVDFNDITKPSATGNVPLVGEVIPSRWAFEALAVTTFADNAYEAPLFDYHRQQYQGQFLSNCYIHELASQLETMQSEKTTGGKVNPSHWAMITNELQRIPRLCNVAPYAGDSSYQSLKDYFKMVDATLMTRSNAATLAADSVTCALIDQMGSDQYHRLRVDHTNSTLEMVVTNAKQPAPATIIDNTIVARMGQMYLNPVTHDGRAPLYSAYKQVGNTLIKTLWFNLMVLSFMAIVIAIMLYTDCPGRYLRRK